MSLSDAADAILGTDDSKAAAAANHQGTSSNATYDASPGAVAKNLLGKITMRKASIFSVSSIGSYVEKKSCSSTEEIYPATAGGKSKLTVGPTVRAFSFLYVYVPISSDMIVVCRHTYFVR